MATVKDRRVPLNLRFCKPDGGLGFGEAPTPDAIGERVMGVEPTTSTLARSHSTTELHPHADWSLIAADFQASQESPSGRPGLGVSLRPLPACATAARC